MGRDSENRRHEFIHEMQRLYKQRPYSDQELADRLGTDRTNIYRIRRLMNEEMGIPIQPDPSQRGRYLIPKEYTISHIPLNRIEAAQLYLAGRRLQQQTRTSQRPVVSALEKLAHALDRPLAEQMVRAAEVVLTQEQDPQQEAVFATLVECWLEGIPVRITHRKLHGEARTYRVRPYQLEPSVWGDGTYLIGHSEWHGKLATFKLARIEKAVKGTGTFTIPEDFNVHELLDHAWGIWHADEAPQAVTLRFSRFVTPRVRETIWHPQQTLLIHDDGSSEWSAPVAEPREMVPWVRGWGVDCEVLGPVGLREALKREARRLAELYDIVVSKATGKLYYAHSKPDIDESEWQLLKDHLVQTGELAFELGRDAGVSDLARVAGLLHDIGKYSQAFQDRLRGSNKRVDHATAGAREIVRLFPAQPQNLFAELLSYCIAGHHSGLPDYGSMGDMENDGTLLARREKKKLEDYTAYATEIDGSLLQLQPLRIKVNRENPGFSISFLTRMLFSTLVDADWLETERYMQGAEKPRGQYASIETLTEQFNRYLQRFENPQSPINQKRTETLQACRAKANHEPGFFTLTVPTGGGKTLASMAFALNHAIAHGLKRIIYVIPFTSIIEQNAAVFRESLGALGGDNVLEHHSNFDWERLRQARDNETNDVYEKLKLAAENWDIPIVVTTNVQFFESLFASKKSRARKLHNIAKSVIIFDEAQTLPRDYIKPSLSAVLELVQNYGVSTVFCTATQPSLQRFFPEGTQFTELDPNPQELFNFYRRVQVKELGTQTDAELLSRLEAQRQVLCIVNTRRHAKGLFDGLKGEGRFHLSTLMCPAHRKVILAQIRQRLEGREFCRVVSTQVMEAGIDVDFPIGYRALAGLDSIIQAAGRINREGKQPSGDMFVFDPKTDLIKRTPIFIEQTSAVAKIILRDFNADPTTIAAIEAYYQLLYTLHGDESFDAKNILGYLNKGPRGLNFDFKTAAENFKLIDDNTVAVVIPYDDEAKMRLKELQYTPYPFTTLRKLQVYSVNVYEREFQSLQSLGVIQTIADVCHVLDEAQMKRFYHLQTGLVLPDSRGGEAIFTD